MLFSERNKLKENNFKLEYSSKTLRNRIYSSFYKEEYYIYDLYEEKTTGIEEMMIEMGVPYKYPENIIYKEENAEKLRTSVVDSKEWYVVYDFIEKYLNKCEKEKADRMEKKFNKILKEEASAYRILNKEVIPVTNKMELETIEEVENSGYESVNIHIKKALSLYADRKNPDYENSIKESISAVESMCCIITGMKGSQSTLGKTLKKLTTSGVHIHPALVNAFESIYGYTSDEDGIRHGSIDFSNAPSEDAKYMLISCSAFINYLIEKYNKTKNGVEVKNG